jgi:aspartate aminotransferase
MADRIDSMRTKLVHTLVEKGSVHDWSHITRQIGMFAFTGITNDMVKELTSNYEIYLTADGRISVAGLNTKNVEYVAESLHNVTKGHSKGSF